MFSYIIYRSNRAVAGMRRLFLRGIEECSLGRREGWGRNGVLSFARRAASLAESKSPFRAA